jgi:hypothetical protein
MDGRANWRRLEGVCYILLILNEFFYEVGFRMKNTGSFIENLCSQRSLYGGYYQSLKEDIY